MVRNSNGRILLDQNDTSQDVKHDHEMKKENYDLIIDRLESQESRLRYAIRKIDQLEKQF